jgi:NAD(P)-dependent dehydrogenase (short-subunit alcohol dehydrogenase family)
MSAADHAKDGERRVAVVTGGGQGLGRATALALSRAGMDVAVIGRTQAKLDETVAMLAGRGLAIAADLSSGEQATAAFARIEQVLGGVDVLINNAAIYSPFRLDEASDEQIWSMIGNSLAGPVFCMREAIRLMRASGKGGDIVNISSQSVQMPQPYMVLYSATKAALETMSRGLRNELRGEPFRIINFSVGVIRAPTSEAIWTSPEFQHRVETAFMESGVAPFFTFPGSSPESLAGSIVHAVTAPRDIYLEQIDARGSFAPDQD